MVFVYFNKAVANNLAGRIDQNGDTVEIVIYIFTSLFILIVGILIVLHRRAQFVVHQMRKLNGLIGIESSTQVHILRAN